MSEMDAMTRRPQVVMEGRGDVNDKGVVKSAVALYLVMRACLSCISSDLEL